MTATRPPKAPIDGRFIRLEPLTRQHLPGLFRAIAHPVVFAGGYGGGLLGLPDTEPAFAEWGEAYFRWDDNPQAVIIVGGPHDGDLVGTTTMTDFDLPREAAHLGWTAYDPRVWGTAVNAEAKLLMLGLAFESGFGRVLIQADSMNARSRAAIAGIGATFEGIRRRDQLRADGTWRDAAVFSVIADDWPRVSQLLETRLAGYGDRPVLFRSPRA